MSSFMLDDSSDTSASPVFKLYTGFEMEFESPSEDEESGSDIFSSDEDISDIVYDSNSSDSYDPEGISSDDDVDGCCHWSRKKQSNPDDDFNMINQNISSSSKHKCWSSLPSR